MSDKTKIKEQCLYSQSTSQLDFQVNSKNEIVISAYHVWLGHSENRWIESTNYCSI